jgi:hypothetical protein
MAREYEKYRVNIICEDKEHYYFIRSFLSSQGFNKYKIHTPYGLPEGSQSGEQFVREHFTAGYQAYARGKENTLLVVMQDVDKPDKEPEDIKNKYKQLLDEQKATDKLLLVFPKRNIETWFEWLGQTPPRTEISETTDFSQKHYNAKPAAVGSAAGALYSKSHTAPSVCDNAPNSLIYACGEFENLCKQL